MRVEDATDETFDALTSTGTVVVAFYTSTLSGYKEIRYKEQTPTASADGLTQKQPRKVRRSDDIRKALKSAAWQHSRKMRVVFVDCTQCPATCRRLDVFAFATFWLLKDGARIADLPGTFEGGHRDSYRLAREDFSKWLEEHLEQSPEA
jgi:hypothetical protein